MILSVPTPVSVLLLLLISASFPSTSVPLPALQVSQSGCSGFSHKSELSVSLPPFLWLLPGTEDVGSPLGASARSQHVPQLTNLPYIQSRDLGRIYCSI